MGWGVHSVSNLLARWSAAWALSLAVTAPALAVDGVIEVNQVRALAGGVTAGDTPGFPVSINTSGSYVLTSNLTTVGTANALSTTAILVASNDVTIDMNGFSILGPTVCDCGEPEATPSCAPNGVGEGIQVTGATVSGLAVFNGQLTGLPANGVQGGQNARISDLTLVGNGGYGASAGTNSIIERVVAACNGGRGVVLTGPGTIRTVAAWDNKLSGIFAVSSRVVVLSSSARDNGEAGISVTGRSMVHASTTTRNGGAGVDASSEMVLNGNVASGNGGVGFSTAQQSLATANLAHDNGGAGFTFGSNSGFQGNSANGNAGGTFVGGSPLATNVCDGVPCP